jgi:hypothetical protein
MKTILQALAVAALVVGCSKPSSSSSSSAAASASAASGGPTAMSVCKQLEGAGVASGCKPIASRPTATQMDPAGDAKDQVEFALVSSPKQIGTVFVFDSSAACEKAAKSYHEVFEALAADTYASPKAKTMVSLNVDATKDEAAKAKKIVESL